MAGTSVADHKLTQRTVSVLDASEVVAGDHKFLEIPAAFGGFVPEFLKGDRWGLLADALQRVCERIAFQRSFESLQSSGISFWFRGVSGIHNRYGLLRRPGLNGFIRPRIPFSCAFPCVTQKVFRLVLHHLV